MKLNRRFTTTDKLITRTTIDRRITIDKLLIIGRLITIENQLTMIDRNYTTIGRQLKQLS